MPRHAQDSIVEWHGLPFDGNGLCHYLRDGFRCTRCGQETEGQARHGAQDENELREVVCEACAQHWLNVEVKQMRLAQQLATAPAPTAPDREVEPIVVEEKLTLW